MKVFPRFVNCFCVETLMVLTESSNYQAQLFYFSYTLIHTISIELQQLFWSHKGHLKDCSNFDWHWSVGF